MARTKAFDTTIVLHRAMKTFGSRGYEGTTLPDLLQELGIARQSLYDTYGTKRDLFILAVKHYMDHKTADLLSLLDQSGEVLPLIEQIFQKMISVLTDNELAQECFIIASAIEYAPHDTELHQYLQDNNAQIEAGFYRLLERAVEQGELGSEVNLTAMAQYLVHERTALIFTTKLGADQAKLNTITEIALSVLYAKTKRQH